MKTLLHRADTRGHANHGWLDSHHTFSFASYYNPDRMNFGALRVLNDDIVSGGMGFATHPHDNMEIISIPLQGELEHADSMGNKHIIKENDVQVMSAGTGIYHSEKNKNHGEEVRFLQIWVFPNKKNVEPRYGQVSIDFDNHKNELVQVVSPNPDDAGAWIHQDAWFHIGHLEEGTMLDYTFKKEGNGLYAFVLEGNVNINSQELHSRDGFGIWETDKAQIKAASEIKLLLMEVPMDF
jgi:redox-sensitive bicupin YhaK (pirin superfamily)